jgi:hypothetical protein
MLDSNMDPDRSSVSMLSANNDRRRRPTEHRTLDEPIPDELHWVVHPSCFLLQDLNVPVCSSFAAVLIGPCLAHMSCKLQIIS